MEQRKDLAWRGQIQNYDYTTFTEIINSKCRKHDSCWCSGATHFLLSFSAWSLVCSWFSCKCIIFHFTTPGTQDQVSGRDSDLWKRWCKADANLIFLSLNFPKFTFCVREKSESLTFGSHWIAFVFLFMYVKLYTKFDFKVIDVQHGYIKPQCFVFHFFFWVWVCWAFIEVQQCLVGVDACLFYFSVGLIWYSDRQPFLALAGCFCHCFIRLVAKMNRRSPVRRI